KDGEHIGSERLQHMAKDITHWRNREITVNAGKAKMCVYKSKPVMCHPGTARIPDICEKMTPECPMEPGRVYTYEHVMRTPNISLRAPATYKLYD
ncbi:unnamed protein product, partial [Dicrocoelium dendriticum]